MATALKIDPASAPARCTHDHFIEYGERDNSSTDDTYTVKGRCLAEDAWYALWISRTTGEIWDERALDSSEIADLRREIWL